MEKLSREEVLHVANLARINLDEEEIERFRVQLKKLIDDIDKIKEVPGMLENVRSNTSSLAYKIKDKPELDLPEEYMKIIENA